MAGDQFWYPSVKFFSVSVIGVLAAFQVAQYIKKRIEGTQVDQENEGSANKILTTIELEHLKEAVFLNM